MIIKIINSILILVLVFMGLTPGLVMLTGKPEMLEMLSKWNFSHTAIIINVSVTMISAFLCSK